MLSWAVAKTGLKRALGCRLVRRGDITKGCPSPLVSSLPREAVAWMAHRPVSTG